MKTDRFVVRLPLVICMFFGLEINALAQPLTRVESSVPGYTGEAEQALPSNTRFSFLDQFEAYGVSLEARSFKGSFVGGLAQGEGVIRLADGQTAGAILPNFYRGTFEAGAPAGDGSLVITRKQTMVQTIATTDTGQLTVSYNDLPVASLMPLPAQSKWLVRLLQYDNDLRHGLPVRMFFGEISSNDPSSEITGEWVDVPWYFEKGAIAVAGYGRYIELRNGDDPSISCELVARPDDDLDLANYLVGRNGWQIQWLNSLDGHVLNAPATCAMTDSSGWLFRATLDFSDPSQPAKLISCRHPSGKPGTVRPNNVCEFSKKVRRHDIFTNIGKEFKRVLDRRIIGTINRIGEPAERSMCRAAGTEPGKNCSVNAQVGVTWPVGEGAADKLPADEQAARNEYIEASRRARSVPGALADTELAAAAAVAADLNAVCVALCHSEGQKQYSASLLTELGRIAAEAPPDAGRSIAAINRETASVIGAGVRAAVILGPVFSIAIPMYRYTKSVADAAHIQTAIDTVRFAEANPTFDYLVRRDRALASLYAVKFAQLSRANLHGAEVWGAAISTNIRILRDFPPNKVTALTAAIAVGRTPSQIREFIEKYKDVKSERELYDALIREAVAPLGLTWPPPE